MEPDWLASDIAANERLRKLKAVTTDGHWCAPEEEDGEITSDGDQHRGGSDWYVTGAVDAVFDDPDGPDPAEVFAPGLHRHPADAVWTAAAHEDDAEARYDRLLAEYRRLLTEGR